MPAASSGPSVRKTPAIKEPMSKSQILSTIADQTGLTRKDVSAVLDELSVLVERHVKKRGAGVFTLPGLLKIKTVRKPATKARKGVPNPFRPGELMDVAAKPARTMVKIQPLKALKTMVE